QLEASIFREYGEVDSGGRRGYDVNKWSNMMVGGKLASPSIKRQDEDCWELPLNWFEEQKNGLEAGPGAGRGLCCARLNACACLMFLELGAARGVARPAPGAVAQPYIYSARFFCVFMRFLGFFHQHKG
ncbi:hypothetical protein A2U01_0027632, partial [Trifolium medium]|nr:hypothetical protein [Trifolium medium]